MLGLMVQLLTFLMRRSMRGAGTSGCKPSAISWSRSNIGRERPSQTTAALRSCVVAVHGGDRDEKYGRLRRTQNKIRDRYAENPGVSFLYSLGHAEKRGYRGIGHQGNSHYFFQLRFRFFVPAASCFLTLTNPSAVSAKRLNPSGFR